MIKKVVSISNIYFKGNSNSASENSVSKEDIPGINKLSNVTQDFNVKTPQRYTSLGISELPNGLKLHSYKLANGYKVSVVPMEDSPAVVKTYVNVGSMNETPDIKGISHFLEHMAFNGTNGENGHMKLETGDSFKKIDNIGGWANASTNYALTDYVNSSPLLENKDLETQIKVLAAMSEDLKLSDKMIDKEKGPVSSEINMIMDDPQTIAMDQTIRTLYNIKNPADELVGGSVKHIQNLTRNDVLNYYNKYYTPQNTNIVVTGDVNPDEVIRIISKNFVSNKKAQGTAFEEKLTPIKNTVRKDFISDKTSSAQIVLGFDGYPNNNIRERILYYIAQAYIDSESVGMNKRLKKLNADYNYGNEKITTKPNGHNLTYICATVSEENTENILKTIYNTIKSTKPITQKELDRIKDLIKERREDSFEYSNSVNNVIGHAVTDGTLADYLNFDKIIDGITTKEVDEAVKKYFNLDKAAITVIHPDNNSEISFKGKESRLPLNEDKISQVTLDNNVEVGFYDVNTPKQYITIDLTTDIPYSKKACVRDVLDEIYSMGTKNLSDDEFSKIKEDLNIDINTYAGIGGLSLTIDGNKKNYKKGLEIAKDLIYNPRITEGTLKRAKKKIRENIERADISANRLYFNDFYSKYNDYAFSDEEKLNALDSITLDDVKEFHKYILENSRGTITTNISGNDENVKPNILKFANSLKAVKPNIKEKINLYKDVEEPLVLTHANNNSQADIKQIYNFETDGSIKNGVIVELMNSILSSSSIGLFDTLREKEHLAYSVYSNVITNNNWGEMSLNILTTTDNKENGEISYENLQKSIEGFNRQIKELVDGKFTDEDLENAKRSLKANLLNTEGTFNKINSIENGLNSEYGINYNNKIYGLIDEITKDDITNFAQNVFSGNPVYSITASQDTLDANKEFLDSLAK